MIRRDIGGERGLKLLLLPKDEAEGYPKLKEENERLKEELAQAKQLLRLANIEKELEISQNEILEEQVSHALDAIEAKETELRNALDAAHLAASLKTEGTSRKVVSDQSNALTIRQLEAFEGIASSPSSSEATPVGYSPSSSEATPVGCSQSIKPLAAVWGDESSFDRLRAASKHLTEFITPQMGQLTLSRKAKSGGGDHITLQDKLARDREALITACDNRGELRDEFLSKLVSFSENLSQFNSSTGIPLKCIAPLVDLLKSHHVVVSEGAKTGSEELKHIVAKSQVRVELYQKLLKCEFKFLTSDPASLQEFEATMAQSGLQAGFERVKEIYDQDFEVVPSFEDTRETLRELSGIIIELYNHDLNMGLIESTRGIC
jgi:hypothetical protein